MNLISPSWIPPGLQPLATFVLGWFLLLYLSASLRPSRYREWATCSAFAAFAGYWYAYAVGCDLGRFSPSFAKDGLGGLLLFFAALATVLQTLEWVEQRLYRRFVFGSRLELTFPKSGPLLTRYPPLIEGRSVEAVPPGK